MLTALIPLILSVKLETTYEANLWGRFNGFSPIDEIV
jgi:hypothetical protein